MNVNLMFQTWSCQRSRAPKVPVNPLPTRAQISSLPALMNSKSYEQIRAVIALTGLRICIAISPIIQKTFAGVSNQIHRASPRLKGIGLFVYAVSEECRLNRTQMINKQHIEKHLDRELKKIPEGWVGIGLHGSRQRAPLILKPREHLYIEVLRSENSIEKKVAQAQYCTFYTQGVGRLYILACRKEEEAAVRKEIQFCVENYISPSDVKDPETGEDRFKLIDITAVQTFRSPYTVFRALNQNASTMMHEGVVIL